MILSHRPFQSYGQDNRQVTLHGADVPGAAMFSMQLIMSSPLSPATSTYLL